MDWFSWLSMTSLDPTLVYEYGLALAYNELEEEDVIYFSHDFLKSIGISVAKHRLEILKLARREHGRRPQLLSRLLAAIKKTKRHFIEYFHSFLKSQPPTLALVPDPMSKSGKVRKKNRKLTGVKPPAALLIGGGNRLNAMDFDPATSLVLSKPMGDQGLTDPNLQDSNIDPGWALMFRDLKLT
ncbi:hypothetical protein EJ110_NYTH18187 [Nymphaea thermarum]|nr:hypothetical protein EJ110_NYTH18187 [Nymphaea thermarum]